MKIKKLISLICIFSFVVSLLTVETFSQENPKFTGNGAITKSTKIHSNNISNLIKNKEKNSKQNSKQNIAISTFSTLESISDPYEPNNDFTSATSMTSDTIYANIGYEGDFDIYNKYFSQGQNMAVSLKNIPSGCDYDLYLCDLNGNILAASESTGDELILGTVNVAGNYLIFVISYTGYSDNQLYKLYAGDALKTAKGSYWSDKLNKLQLNYANTDSAIDSLDLTYNGSIPNDAIITSMYLNGYFTGNFTGMQLYTYVPQYGWQAANFSDMCDQAVGESVKQLWQYKWSVSQITQPIASWTPQILINYQYTSIPY